MLAAEWCHLDQSTLSLASTNPGNILPPDINQVLATSRTMSNDLIVEQQQVPPATIGGNGSPIDNVLVDLTQAAMWYTQLTNQSFEPPSNTSTNGAYFTLLNFSLGPWGSNTGVTGGTANATFSYQ